MHTFCQCSYIIRLSNLMIQTLDRRIKACAGKRWSRYPLLTDNYLIVINLLSCSSYEGSWICSYGQNGLETCLQSSKIQNFHYPAYFDWYCTDLSHFIVVVLESLHVINVGRCCIETPESHEKLESGENIFFSRN